MACRVKTLANKHLEGSFKNQFRRIYDYAHETIRLNPRSIENVKVDTNEGGTYFMRFCV